ncbi:hypothetical protein [Thermosporothrix hazakensis]|uniref:hypothetical protein n=1 Tax=Thermosporothrix hazakensis TaxID=644383 RepID=UPI001B8831E5|nr:hypothetical protein [Thermosporothrix hazakensis]
MSDCEGSFDACIERTFRTEQPLWLKVVTNNPLYKEVKDVRAVRAGKPRQLPQPADGRVAAGVH